jgi:hypothetical protein
MNQTEFSGTLVLTLLTSILSWFRLSTLVAASLWLEFSLENGRVRLFSQADNAWGFWSR